MAINLSMSFVDFPWRYAHVPPAEMQLRLYQNMAHGGPPAIAVVGTMEQAGPAGPDRRAAGLPVARAARRPLRRPAERRARAAAGDGRHARLSRLLPTADRAAHPVRGLREPASWIDGAVAPLRSGHRARARAAAGARAVRARAAAACSSPERRRRRFPIGTVVGRRTTQGYWRIHDRDALPSLTDTDLLFLDGDYVELAPLDASAPHADSDGDVRAARKGVERQGRDDGPGLVFAEHGQGTRRVHPVGRRRALLPPQFAGARRADGRRDRSSCCRTAGSCRPTRTRSSR